MSTFYAKGWRQFFPRRLPATGVELTEQASLIREPNNRHDRNAVRVEVRKIKTDGVPMTVFEPVLTAAGEAGCTPP